MIYIFIIKYIIFNYLLNITNIDRENYIFININNFII